MPSTRRRTAGPAISPVIGLLLATSLLLGGPAALGSGSGQPAAAAPAAEHPAVGVDGASAPAPVGVRSPAVDIAAPTIPLGTRDDGRLEVPGDAQTAGWWTGGADPGERGPAVIVGHVDSRDGPGAFWELGDLEPDDRVTVDREDGTSLQWRVDRLEEHPKDDFPTQDVYGDTDAPTLRLITCSGFFDPEARSYVSNTIVYLTLDEDHDAASPHAGPDAAAPPGPATSTALVSAVQPLDDEAARTLPIAIAVLMLLLCCAALGREWAVGR